MKTSSVPRLAAFAAAVLTLGACTYSAPAPAPASFGTAPPPTRSIDNTMRAFVDQGSVAVVAEVRWPGGMWSRAYGVRNLEAREPATPEDQVFVASVTKSMTAVSVMKLVEDGLIGLDDPVNAVLDSFTTVLKPPGPITVRQLLGHTSGMRSFQEANEKTSDDVPRLIKENISTQRALELTAQLPWDARDVGYFRYSDSNYIALGQLVEKLRGRPFTDVLRGDGIDRLSLEDTSLNEAATADPGVIHGYITHRDKRLDVTEAPGILGSPAYGAISTMSDINDFYGALFRGELVSKESLQEMTKTEAIPLFGLGLRKWSQGCDDDYRFGHTGGFWTYRTASLASTDGQYQATMTLVPPPMPTPLEDPETEDKINGWDGQMVSALQETLNRLCP
ncbi:serine hydrolase domain-containing protein [Arthrobacter sp. ZGTC412]|uniref:serine hydrolase domain-containing protein n=1 Tax=Arthrobacter sp. ZGTC412 TaxID=2058900 RepID=UPI000CE3FF9C|nr:serine hydrolase domain-containing protein [Arthrobacter sp. ZGTC412]